MSEGELGRIRDDLAVMRRAMGLQLSFGKGTLAFGVILTMVALGAALFSLFLEDDWLQATLFAAIILSVPVGLFLRSFRTSGPSPEVRMQVLLSISIYAVVWTAGAGYAIAAYAGPAVGLARTIGLYASSIGLLFAFSLMLVHAALRSREQYYCLGFAISTLLAGMLLPLLSQHYSDFVAHGSMAMGYLAAVVIQRVQLREAEANRAAD